MSEQFFFDHCVMNAEQRMACNDVEREKKGPNWLSFIFVPT